MRRGRVIGVAAGVVALLAGGALVWWLVVRPPSAEETARRYLDALAAGDFDTIDDLRAEPLQADAEAILEEAFAGASAYVQSPEIVEVSTDGGAAAVQGTVELAGERHTIEFGLSAQTGRWMLTGDYLGTLEVTTSIGDSVWVGAALAPAAAPILLLPAVYPVQAAPRGLVAGDATAVVVDPSPAPVTVDASLTPEATVQAQARLDDYADTCAEPATAVPDHCGLKIPWAADLATLSALAFRIDTRPILVLSPDATTFAAAGGVIIATASGTTRTGSEGTFTYRSEDWTLRGTVALMGDEMVLAVD